MPIPDEAPKKSAATACDKLWIALGDIHDEMDNFRKIPELATADGVIISGDLTVNGSVKKAEKVMDAIAQLNLPVLAQIGNMDRPEINVWLNEKGVNLHTSVYELSPRIAVFGAGGSTFTPFGTPSEFPESEYTGWLENCWREARNYPQTVLVSHNPPKDTVCDAINENTHVGSTAVREFIEEAQPDICICGHIHEGKGFDHIGRTLVINPGTLAQGGYVILRCKNGVLSAELAQIPA